MVLLSFHVTVVDNGAPCYHSLDKEMCLWVILRLVGAGLETK